MDDNVIDVKAREVSEWDNFTRGFKHGLSVPSFVPSIGRVSLFLAVVIFVLGMAGIALT